MTILDILKYIIVGSGLILTVTILLQARSGGLGTVFGGSSGGETYRSKRGIEAVLYNLTIAMIVVFAGASMALAALSI